LEWNATVRDYPQDATVHELFEAQAARTPDAISVVGANEQLTYRELNRRANALARRLREAGIGPEKLVGVCLERSRAMVVALMAIQKAGAAYVPLDPQYPRERLRFMLSDARVRLVLTDASAEGVLPSDGLAQWRMDEPRPS